MRPGALQPYEQSLSRRGPLRMAHDSGRTVSLDIERWLAAADTTDHEVLSRALSPVLDIGCGPGRILAALAEHGLLGLGIDIAPTAVTLSRAAGLNCLHRSVFDHLPGEGRWKTVLLLDGNIGIGGAPECLLRRSRELMTHTGRVIVESDPDPAVDERGLARFMTGGRPQGPRFSWAFTGQRAIERYAREAGLQVSEIWERSGRTFMVLSNDSDG